MRKHVENVVPARRPAALLLALAGAVWGCLPVHAGEDREKESARISLDVASKEIMRIHATLPGGQAREDEKPAVSEYRIEGLWEETGMQLFRLDHGGWQSSNFLAVDGKLTILKVPTFGGAGLTQGVVHEKVLYLTSEWGSGIARTALYRIRRDKEGKVEAGELGVITSTGGAFDKKFLEDATVKKVMALLQPLKRGKALKVGATTR